MKSKIRIKTIVEYDKTGIGESKVYDWQFSYLMAWLNDTLASPRIKKVIIEVVNPLDLSV